VASFDRAFEKVLELEGGFVNHRSDPGGATNFGISIRYLLDRGDLDRDGLPDGDVDGDGDIDIDDIRALTPAAAKHLYHTGFWLPNRLYEVLNQEVGEKIFDMVVNMGSRQAWKLVQRALNGRAYSGAPLVVDGIVGPNTLNALNDLARNATLIEAIRDEQRSFYQRLILKRPSLAVFENGWMNRAAA
jgi:lysozyme family protein